MSALNILFTFSKFQILVHFLLYWLCNIKKITCKTDNYEQAYFHLNSIPIQFIDFHFGDFIFVMIYYSIQLFNATKFLSCPQNLIVTWYWKNFILSNDSSKNMKNTLLSEPYGKFKFFLFYFTISCENKSFRRLSNLAWKKVWDSMTK